MENTIMKAAQVRPLARQETEFYAFVHFSPNTFTNIEQSRVCPTLSYVGVFDGKEG
jgi:hypothetical protein